MIIQFYDSDGTEGYPSLFEIEKNGFKELKKILDKYRKENEEEYNFDDFMDLIKKENWFIRFLDIDKEVYF